MIDHRLTTVPSGEISRLGMEPDTTRALLFCEPEGSPRKHEFAGKRDVRTSAGDHVYSELIYRCSCGNHRVWGTEG